MPYNFYTEIVFGQDNLYELYEEMVFSSHTFLSTGLESGYTLRFYWPADPLKISKTPWPPSVTERSSVKAEVCPLAGRGGGRSVVRSVGLPSSPSFTLVRLPSFRPSVRPSVQASIQCEM